MQKIYKTLRRWLILCCCLIVSISAYAGIEIDSVDPESAPGARDGRIVVRAIGSAGPFDFLLTGVSGAATGYTDTRDNQEIAFFEDLPGGDYEVTVENAYGCGLLLEVTMETCPAFFFNETISPAYCDQNNGSIILDIENNSILTFLWSDEVTTQNRTNLAAGLYRLTVTDATQENCRYIDEFEVEELETSFIVSPMEYQHASEPQTQDGRLVLQAIPTSGTYSYQWSDGAIGATRNNLFVGNYTVTITDNLGCSQVKLYRIKSCRVAIDNPDDPPGGPIILEDAYPPFDILVSGGLILSIQDQMTCSVLLREGEGDFSINFPPDYVVEWYLDGELIGNRQTVTFNKNDYTQSANAFITVRVSNGCEEQEATQTFIQCGADNEQAADFFIINQVKPCSGTRDGRVTIGFRNPGIEEEISILIDGFEFPYEENGTLITSTVGSLEAGRLYQVSINIGACSFSFEFKLSAAETQSIYQGFEEGAGGFDLGACIYEEFCKGNSLGEYGESAQFNWDASSGGLFSKCKTPLACGGEEVEDKKFGKKWASAGVYLQELLATNNPSNSPFYTQPYIDFLQRVFNEEIGSDKLCQMVLYCKGSLKFINKMPLAITGATSVSIFQNSVMVNPSTGCQEIKCPILANYDVCNFHLEVNGPAPEISNCQPVTMSVYQLSLYEDIYETAFPNTFPDSEIDMFIQEHAHKPEAKCATVSFCFSDFTYLADNLTEIAPYCGQPLIAPTNPNNHIYCNEFFYDEDRRTSMTFCPSFDCEYPALFCNPLVFTYYPDPECGTIDCLTSSGDISLKAVNESIVEENLINFGISKSNQAINPAGMIDSNEGMFLDNYHPTSTTIKKESISHTEFMIEDWENEHVIYVETQEEDQSYKVILDGSSSTWIKNLESNNSLDIQHLSSTQSEIVIGGTFSGALSYDGAVIANSNMSVAANSNVSAAFLIRLSNTGQLSHHFMIEHLDLTDELLFSENRDGAVVIGGRYDNNLLKVNGATWNMSGTNGWFFLQVAANNQATLISDLAVDDDYQLLDVNYSFDQSRLSFAAYGRGAMSVNGENIVTANSIFTANRPQLVLVNQYVDGTINWSHLIPGGFINPNKFDMAFGEVNNTFVGLTFEEKIRIQRETLTSKGQEDIALLHLTADGVKIWTKQYGDQDNETISQLLYDNTVIYFGGEFDGASPTRTIGKYKFVNPYGLTASKSYISYLLDEHSGDNLYLTNPSAVEERQAVDESLSIPTAATLRCYPNPFNESTTIAYELPQSTEVDIAIYGMRGEKVAQLLSDEHLEQGPHQIHFPASDMSKGIYYLVLRAGKEVLTEKLVVIGR